MSPPWRGSGSGGLEIFSPLSHGGELVIAPSEVRSDPEAIVNLLQSARITHSYIPPAMLRLLRQQADKAGLTLEWERVRIVRGDLAEPDLGLNPATRQQLASELDAIIHCGAFVHHLHNYQTMKAANVDSTISLLQLALAPRQGLAVRNLSNPQSLSQGEFFGHLAKLGFAVRGEAPKVWQQRLNTLSEQNGLSQIREFYTGELNGPSFPIEQSETLAELARLDASLAVDYGRLLPLYVAYLRQVGFLS